MTSSDRDVIDCGHGVKLEGFRDRAVGIADAVARGHIFCMPLKKNVQPDPARWTEVNCPRCGEPCFRAHYVPAEAIAACTACAIKAGISAARNAP